MADWEANVRRVVPYTPGEQPKRTDIIKLNTNECPYPPAPGVTKALQEFEADKLRLYPDPAALELRLQRRFLFRSIRLRQTRCLWALAPTMCWRWHF